MNRFFEKSPMSEPGTSAQTMLESAHIGFSVNTPHEPDGSDHSIAFADKARVIGIGLVVVQHFCQLAFGNVRHFAILERSTAYFGVLGVALLFILSGYLLSRPFLGALLSGAGLPSVSRFLSKRFLRIYPLYLFSIVSISIFDYFSGSKLVLQPVLPATITHLFLIFNFSLVTAEQIQSPLWTMAVDAQFYLLLPLLAITIQAILRRGPSNQYASKIWMILATLSLTGIIIRLVVMLVRPESAATFAQQIVFLKQVPEMALSFAIGASIALFEHTGFIVRRRALFLYAGITVAVIHALSRAHVHGSQSSFANAVGFALYDAIAAIAAGLIFVGLPRDQNFKTVVSTAAALSYAIYLFHYPILAFVAKELSTDTVLRAILMAVAFVVVIVPVAYVSHTFVEKPFLILKARLRTSK